MRLVVHDYSGHPFQVQLSRALASRGHDVLHLHCSSYVTGKGALVRKDDDPPGFSVDAVDLGGTFEKYSFFKRLSQEYRYARRCAARIRDYRPELVLSSNTPLFAQWLLLPRIRRLGARFVFWQQDIYSVAMGNAARSAVPVLGRIAARIFERMEVRLLRKSDRIVVISPDFAPVLRQWGLSESKVDVIENWAPIDELPRMNRSNSWSREVGLAGRRVVLYSGTLGLKHNPALLLELAQRLRERTDDAVLVVVSEGLGAEWLRDNAGPQLERTMLQLPFQPFERLPEVLASADVLVAILEPEASIFSVPSKVLSYHCAGRPVLAAIPRENLAARIIQRVGSGVVVDPSDPNGFVREAIRLLDDSDAAAMGDRARAYAESTFDIVSIAGQFEESFHRATVDGAGRDGAPIGRLARSGRGRLWRFGGGQVPRGPM